MDSTMGLDQPVMLHSSRDDICKLTVEQCAYRGGHWRYWYIADWVYGLGTVYFFMTAIGVCALGFWALRLSPRTLRKRPVWQKLVSSFRFITYRRFQLGQNGYNASIGALILLTIGTAFFFAMTLGPRPYYWPNTRTISYGNSPPLATRAGWMALGCLPFIIILPTKTNVIASLTGVSHDRLIIFHNWVGWAMLALALIHTFPFIVFRKWKGDLDMQWSTSIFYWSGVAALIPQAYLQFMSIGFIRNRFYEFFKGTHYLAAAFFVLFLFFHCDFRLTSWDYFIATGIIYTLSWLYSQIRVYFEHGTSRRATFEMVSDVCMRITIPINTTWTPFQHVFLRFVALGTHSLTAHPFTICSVPSHQEGKTKMVFYVHPKRGITGRLAKITSRQPGYNVPVLIDGPYGGIKGRPLEEYDRSLIITCGSGAALSLAKAMGVMVRSAQLDGGQPPHHMQIVLATRDKQLVEWYEEALLDFMEETGTSWPEGKLDITIYRTGSDSSRSLSMDTEKHLQSSAAATSPRRLPITVTAGRPKISELVRDATLESDLTLGILACGPSGVLHEVQREAASAQLRIMTSKSGAKEVYLHSELFSKGGSAAHFLIVTLKQIWRRRSC